MATPLFDPKTFTAEQAAMLNNVPGQSLSQTNTLQQLRSAGANIPVDQIGPARPVGITNPEPSAAADAVVAGANAGVRSYEDYLKMLQGDEMSATATEAEQLRDEVGNLLPQAGGRGAAQLEAEKTAGVGNLRTELADLNAQILAKTAEYNKLATSIEGKPITMSSIIGEQAQVRKAQAADIGLLQALALGKQGMLTAAQDAADRAVDLKYDDIETQIDIRLKQLDLLSPTLDAEEKRRSQALELFLTQEKERVAEQKSDAKGFQNDKLNAIMDGAPVSVAQQAQSLFDSGRIEEAYAVLARYSGGGGTKSTFTQTQLNQGAATANISIEDFGRLDNDTKNFFISNKKNFIDQKSAIYDGVISGEDPSAIEATIQELDIPESAKDSLVRYLWTGVREDAAMKGEEEFLPDAYRTDVNTPTESESEPWWKFW